MITSTPPISLTDVLTEIRRVNPGRALPISLGDADVRALAGIPSGPISLSDLYGKSSYTPMTLTVTGGAASGSSILGGGVVSASASVSVSGGSGGTTLLWAVVSNPGGCSIGPLTGSSVTASHSFVKSSIGSASVVLHVTATDNTSHSVTSADVSIDLDWD